MSNNTAHPFKVLGCEKCETKWHSATLWRYFVYALPDGRKISVDKKWAWCDDCNSFEAVEYLPTHHKITTDIRAATAGIAKTTSKLQGAEKKLAAPPVSVMEKFWVAFSRLILKQKPLTEKDLSAMREKIRFQQRALDDLLVRKEFLALRTTPAKCLTCGGTNISYVDLPELPFEAANTQSALVTRYTHKGCGGKLWLTSAEKSKITTAEGMRLYDYNGVRLIPRQSGNPCAVQAEERGDKLRLS